METPTTAPHTFIEAGLGVLATILGTIVVYLFKRQQSTADTEGTRADTAKTRAETSQIESVTAQGYASIMLEMIKEASAQTARADRLADERDHWERKAGYWQDEAKDLRVEVGVVRSANRILELEVQRMRKAAPQLPPFKEPIE